MNTSYSALDTFLTRPRKYKYAAVDKIKTPKSKEQFFGTLLHNTLRFAHKPGMLSPTLEQTLDYYSKNWNAVVFSDETEERAAFSQGVQMLQDYYKKNDPAGANVVDLESRFQVEIGDGENKHILSGIIDRIDRIADGYEIIDYKTTRKMPSQEKVDNDLQLSIYLAGFLRRYPKEKDNLKNIKVSLYYLKHGVKLSSERSAEQLQESAELVLNLLGEIEKSEFEPRLSALCGWCGYQDICPLWKHKYQESKDRQDLDIKSLADEYVTLKDDIKEKNEQIGGLLKVISEYMDQEKIERVFGGKGSILRCIRKSYKYDPERLRQILEPLDKWEDILKIDGIALRQILGVLPHKVRKEIDKAKEIDKESKSSIIKKGE